MYGPLPVFEREENQRSLAQVEHFFRKLEGAGRAKPFVAKCLGEDWNVPRIEYALARRRFGMRGVHRDPESKL